MKTRTVVGDVINFRGMVYAPVNEQGVVFLFGKIAHELGFQVELVRSRYPDCGAKRFKAKNQWDHVLIEFEFKSSGFVSHHHDESGCDILVCWEHDWPQCPQSIEVIELRKEIKKLESRPSPVVPRQLGLKKRDKEMRDLVLKDGVPRKKVAEMYGLSEMSISRILRGTQRKGTGKVKKGGGLC